MIWDPKRLRDRTEHPDPPRREPTEIEHAVDRLLEAKRRLDLARGEPTERAELKQFRDALAKALRLALRAQRLNRPAETGEQVVKRLRDALRPAEHPTRCAGLG